jgi:hypothetical protein
MHFELEEHIVSERVRKNSCSPFISFSLESSIVVSPFDLKESYRFMSARHLDAVLAFCLLFSLICLGFLVGFVVAGSLSRVAGVKVGDMAKYGNFLALWASESPGTPPQNFVDVNNTLSLVNTVLEVSNNTVSFESRTVYRNGTEQVEVNSVDVAYGSGLGNLTFVAAKLGVGDSIYAAEEFSEYRINSTSLRDYCGVMRETNLINATQELSDVGAAFWTQLYWDKATGLLVEHSWSYAELSETGLLTEASVSYSMVDNNVWVGVSDSVMPIARAGSDRTVDVGATVVFDGGESWDNVGIVRVQWDFGDGESAMGLSVSHVYGRTGAFNVTLTVEDSAGNKGSDRVIVTVREQANPILTPGLAFLIVGLVVLVGWLSVRWAMLRKRRLRGKERRRR